MPRIIVPETRDYSKLIARPKGLAASGTCNMCSGRCCSCGKSARRNIKKK